MSKDIPPNYHIPDCCAICKYYYVEMVYWSCGDHYFRDGCKKYPKHHDCEKWGLFWIEFDYAYSADSAVSIAKKLETWDGFYSNWRELEKEIEDE